VMFIKRGWSADTVTFKVQYLPESQRSLSRP
jgi:hypothetical protein